MSKSLFYFAQIAFLSSFFISCSKEVVDDSSSKSIQDMAIPEEFKAIIIDDESDSKTAYEFLADRIRFTWSYADVVRMPVKQEGTGDNEGKQQVNFFTFITSSSSGSRIATFIRNNHSENLNSFDPIPTGWTSLGYVVYPASCFPDSYIGPYPTYDMIHMRLAPTFDYDTEVPLKGENVPLVGKKNGSDYQFYTAVAILRVSLTNIPSTATAIVLSSTTDNISGNFNVSEVSSIPQVAKGSGKSGLTKVKTINISELDPAQTYDFYFPMPVGSYAENTLSIKVMIGDYVLDTKTIAKSITLNRGEIFAAPTLTAPEKWVEIGTASYKDSFIWPGDAAVDVTLERNTHNQNKYRINNPYNAKHVNGGIPSTTNSATWNGNCADYMEISVDRTNNTASYGKFNTGFSMTSGTTTKEIALEPYSNDGQNVVEGASYTEEGIPNFLSLNGKYQDKDKASWNWQRNAITIEYPKISQPENSIELTENMLSVQSSHTNDGGGVAALCDGQRLTYWHSNYNNNSGTTTGQGIWIQIDLGENKTVSNFTLRFLTRYNVTHGLPTKYRIEVSNDATEWVNTTGIDIDISASTTAYKWFEQSVTSGGSYRYIRLCITEMNHTNSGSTAVSLTNITTGGGKYTHLAEIQLIED